MIMSAILQGRIASSEAAHKKTKAELNESRSQVASLEQQYSQLQAKLKAAQDELTSVRSQAAHKQVHHVMSIIYPCTDMLGCYKPAVTLLDSLCYVQAPASLT